jgi:hypothetical protein
MTRDAEKVKAKQEDKQQHSLKGVLADVLKKHEAASPPSPVPNKKEPPAPPSPTSSQKPFEVPEEELRKVLKGEE